VRFRSSAASPFLALILTACASSSSGTRPEAAPPERKQQERPPPDPLPKGDHALHHEERLISSCGGRCTFRERSESHVELHFDKHADLTVQAEGAHLEQFDSIVGRRDELVRWKRRWNGSWRQTKDRLRLSLVPDEPECTYDPASDDAVCMPIALELACEPRSVVVRGKPATTELSWVCNLVKGIDMPDTLTPFPWVFGMARPLTARDTGLEHNPKRRYVLLNPPKEKRRGRR
jgi:hypothetical protein